jgi:hypothetical protein
VLPASNVDSITKSLLQKPLNRGTPDRERTPTAEVQKVIGILERSPPISSRLFVWTACMTEPAARNRSALKMLWLRTWKVPPSKPVSEAMARAANIRASWLMVEYATTRFMSFETSPMVAAKKAVKPAIIAIVKYHSDRAAGGKASKGVTVRTIRATR